MSIGFPGIKNILLDTKIFDLGLNLAEIYQFEIMAANPNFVKLNIESRVSQPDLWKHSYAD